MCIRDRYNKIQMTSANGGTYAGQYPCHGWVDDLELTPSVEYASWFHILSTTGREWKRRAMCIWGDLNEIFRRHHSCCVLVWVKSVSEPCLIEKEKLSTTCSRTRYASTWFAYLESLAFGFSLSHCLWPHNLYLSRMKNQEGHCGYWWCRWVERTV